MMGHRALVARQRDDGRYDCYYSHWGGADVSLARELGQKPWSHDLVDPAPVATDVARDEIFDEHLDPLLYEAFYLLPTDGDPRAFRPCWLGPLLDRGLVIRVAPDDPADDGYVRGWLDGAGDVLTAAIERVHLDSERAASTIKTELHDRLADREVVWLDESW